MDTLAMSSEPTLSAALILASTSCSVTACDEDVLQQGRWNLVVGPCYNIQCYSNDTACVHQQITASRKFQAPSAFSPAAAAEARAHIKLI